MIAIITIIDPKYLFVLKSNISGKIPKTTFDDATNNSILLLTYYGILFIEYTFQFFNVIKKLKLKQNM